MELHLNNEPGIYLVYSNDATPDARDKVEFDLGNQFDAVYSFQDMLSKEVVTAIEDTYEFRVDCVANAQDRADARIRFWREENLRVLVYELFDSSSFMMTDEHHARAAQDSRRGWGLPTMLDWITTASIQYKNGCYYCWRWKHGAPSELADVLNCQAEAFRIGLEAVLQEEEYPPDEILPPPTPERFSAKEVWMFYILGILTAVVVYNLAKSFRL